MLEEAAPSWRTLASMVKVLGSVSERTNVSVFCAAGKNQAPHSAAATQDVGGDGDDGGGRGGGVGDGRGVVNVKLNVASEHLKLASEHATEKLSEPAVHSAPFQPSPYESNNVAVQTEPATMSTLPEYGGSPPESAVPSVQARDHEISPG